MVRELRRRARRVAGAPEGVVAWIDHDRHPDYLLLNAGCFTARDEAAISAVLAGGRYTARQVLDALITGG